MNPVLIYLVKVSGAFALFYLCYKLFLSKDTYFVRNRFYLLGCMIFSLVVPFIKITVKTVKVNAISEIVPVVTNTQVDGLPVKDHFWPLILGITLFIYTIGVLFFLIRLIRAYSQAIGIILKAERSKFYELILAITQQTESPFSLFKWLVIPKNTTNHPDFENIVQHESIHSRQYHSVDLFMAEIIVVFQWFNPFVWMMKKAVIENHEYFVDKALLRKGVNVRQYQYSLLSFVTASGGQLAVANHFNANLLKKRIRMMNTTQSPRWQRIKNVLILVSAVIVVLTTVSFETKVIAQTSQDSPVVIIHKQKDTPEQLLKMNPVGFKSVAVLKDSLAVALYGEEGRNGAIIVEFKDTVLNNTMFIVHDTLSNNKIRIIGSEQHDTLNKVLSINNAKPLVILDGQKSTHDILNSKMANLEKVEVIKGTRAKELYGEEARDGVIIGTSKKSSGIKIVSKGSVTENQPLIVIDGEISKINLDDIDPESIQSINVLKNESALSKYGEAGKNGVVEIFKKK
jgi:beta-lactamase regulating signal transducer with metallopeptidase domain